MKAVRTLKSQSGFSLIELMIVVAIIGILATIAVPNFQKFQAKAKQAEAKTNLAAVFGAMKAFNAEWSQYYGVFADIGYVPEGKVNYRLTTGGAGTAPATLTPAAAPAAGAGCSDTQGCATLQIVRTPAHDLATAVAGTTAPDQTSFTAGAGARLTEGADNRIDTWLIDQNKNLRNNVNGI